MKRLPVNFGWALRCELPQILAIEQESFGNPWTEEQFLALLRQRNVIGMVARRAKKITAYAIYELERHSVHLLNLTVDPGLRRYEVGTQFVDKLKTKLGGRRNAIHFQIRETNTPGVLFFARQGFAAIDVKRGYFDDTAEDAYVMRFLHRPERDPFAEEEEQFRNRVSRYLGGTR